MDKGSDEDVRMSEKFLARDLDPQWVLTPDFMIITCINVKFVTSASK